jgi:hypothetical protein
MIIEIKGINKAQEIAIGDFFAKIQQCGENNSSRWIALFADGANNWGNIDVTVDGLKPAHCGIPADVTRWWHLYFKHNEEYSPEPFYLAESYTIEEALERKQKISDEADKEKNN